MCDDACARGGGTTRQAESLHCAFQVNLLPRGTERHALAKGWVVNLDDLAPSGLKGVNLGTECQPKLQCLLLLGDVLARERPVKNGDGTGEHTLHVLLAGPVLRNLPLLDCHGLDMRDVLDDNRRAGVAAAVRLYPTILGESKAVKLLREILDHVGTFRFSMHKDVEANGFLNSDAVADVLVDFLVVLLLADLSLAELEADGTQLRHLGEATDARGPELRKIQLSCLQSKAGLSGVFAREECLRHDDRLVWNARRGRSLSALGKKHYVGQLLDGKAQSLLELGRERRFCVHIIGKVHQR
mmetsp:Transcript_103359/g.166608  ORF Transcript_103359/g.166608 Transcript_103359/m.166608 type:complete len:299 (-) Transcript_103359:749-1645(-)